jgi:dehydrogenase/reductase SDR family protein 4
MKGVEKMNGKYDFSGKVAIVTGASRGIGKAIAKGFAASKAKVVLSSRKQPDLEAVAEEIEKDGGQAVAIAAHAGKIDDLNSLVEKTLENYNGIDILVNNAGTNPVFGPVMNSEEPAWDKIMDVNLKGPFFLGKAVVNAMQGNKPGASGMKGVIVNIASNAGVRPAMGLGVYSVSKAGLIMLTKVMASEWGELGIRVNAIAPGLIETRFSEALWKNDMVRKMAESASALGRIGKPEEIVGAALYLASEDSSYMTGQVMLLDGGSGLKGV